MTFLRVTASTVMDPTQAFTCFWNMSLLQAFWDPISRVEVLYDDGGHQEARMSVHRDGREENIRIIRFRVDADIVFFNPTPPPMMRYHRGAWRFASQPAGGCTVSAEREYELTRNTAESDDEYATRAKTFDVDLQKRLQSLLEALSHTTVDVGAHKSKWR